MSQLLVNTMPAVNRKWLTTFSLFLLLALIVSFVTWFVPWLVPHGALGGPLHIFFETKSLAGLAHSEIKLIWFWKALVVLEFILPLIILWLTRRASARQRAMPRWILLGWTVVFFLSYLVLPYGFFSEPVTLGDISLVGWSYKAWLRAVVTIFALLFWRKLKPMNRMSGQW